MYLLYCIRSDITFAMRQLSKYNADSKVSYLKATKWVVRYLKGKMHLRLVYNIASDINSQLLYGLIKYVNSNYAGNLEDYKLVIRYYFFINRAIVSWYNKKQRTVFISTTETKYIALGHAAQESIWIIHFLNELGITKPIVACLLCRDNETSIIFTKNMESQACTKHIDVQHHSIWELVTKNELFIEWIYSANMLANGFTKALTIDNLRRYQSLFGMSSQKSDEDCEMIYNERPL